MKSLLLFIVVGATCFVDWWIAGRKGAALVGRRRSYPNWCVCEWVLGCIVAGSIFVALADGLLERFSVMAGGAIGCWLGSALSGVVVWRRK